jgi:hypothetical protein
MKNVMYSGASMSQEVRKLKLKDLVLWTENPRDPVDATATDQEIVDKAYADKDAKWNLPRLIKEMGKHYDFSELPTVVFHGEKPVVYDGNRRVVLGKIKHGLVTLDGFDTASLPVIPDEIPCNVCSQKIALDNVWRKHAETGSWLPLDRDIFLHKYMKEKKSAFLLMEENTGLISANPHLNQRFVKDEIFREDILNKLGLSFVEDKLHSKHSKGETLALLGDISEKIREKQISTRQNRGKVIEILDPESQRIVEEHKKHKAKPLAIKPSKNSGSQEKTKARQSKRVRAKATQIFGGPLYLRLGLVSNMYRDIVDIHGFYHEKKASLSDVFPAFIRMALRPLCEAAAKECGEDLDSYIKARVQAAKATLDQNIKTTLSNHNVTDKSIVQLLHTGAHNYDAAANLEQTLALSIILGAILTASHGQAKTK